MATWTRTLQPSRRAPRAEFVGTGDPGLAAILEWVLLCFPGIKGGRAWDGYVLVEQVLQGWVEDGEVRGEARHALTWPGIQSAAFLIPSREVQLVRRLRYDELPPELWGPTVA